MIHFKEIDWMKVLDYIEKVFIVIAGLFSFWVIVWKKWARKKWELWWYRRDIKLDHIIKVQENMIVSVAGYGEEIKAIKCQIFPNGNPNNLNGLVTQIYENQILVKNDLSAKTYLDLTPMLRTDLQGNCLDANLAYLKLAGFSSFEEARGTGYRRSIHPDDRDRVVVEFLQAIKGGNMFISSFRQINILTGDIYHAVEMTKIINNSKDEPSEVLCTFSVEQNLPPLK